MVASEGTSTGSLAGDRRLHMSSSDSANAASNGDRYRILLEASRRLGATLSPDELHEAIYRETAAALPAPGFYLALHDQGRDLARVVFYAEQGEGQHADVAYRGSDSEILTTQKALLTRDDLADASSVTATSGANIITAAITGVHRVGSGAVGDGR